MRKTKDSAAKKNGYMLALEVLLGLPKPNEMFPEWMTERLRFLTYSKPVSCAVCGKNRLHHWTMLCAFKAGTFSDAIFAIPMSERLEPLTPVCTDHPLNPLFDKHA